MLTAAVALAGCGVADSAVQASGPGVATDGEPPPTADSFRGKLAPLSADMRGKLRSSGIRIEDLDPDVVRPRITAAKLARHRGHMGPVQPSWEASPWPLSRRNDRAAGMTEQLVGFGRVTADTPCEHVGWKLVGG